MSRQFDLYLAGPMSGLPDFNHPAFHTAPATPNTVAQATRDTQPDCLPAMHYPLLPQKDSNPTDHTLTAAEVEALEHVEALAEERWATAWVMAGVGLVATVASCLAYLVCALGLL